MDIDNDDAMRDWNKENQYPFDKTDLIQEQNNKNENDLDAFDDKKLAKRKF